MKFIILSLVTIMSIFILDIMWLGFIAKKLYIENIGILLRKSGGDMVPIWWSVILIYVCIALGILFFVLPKAQDNYFLAFCYGALLGLVIYGTYEFTNYALLANWTWKITLIDVIWGMVLCGLTSLFSTFIQNRFL